MDINAILDIGLILLAATLGASIKEYIKLPRISFYIIIGIIIGPSMLNLVSAGLMESSELLTHIALSFIAFELGKKFSLEKIKKIGKKVFGLAIVQVITTFILVAGGVYFLMNSSLPISLIYGAIASATAPAATILVAKEYNAKGDFTDTLLGTVALDDGLGIIMFALFFAIASSITAGTQANTNPVLMSFLYSCREIIGAVALGVALGWILSHLPRIIEKNANLMIYTLGFILLTTGLSIHFDFSILLANMALGITVENINKSEVKFFDVVKKIESPFYVLFFVLAGAHLKVDMVSHSSLIGGGYILFRILGKISGVYLGGALVNATNIVKNYMGMAMLCQAGVALGFALIVKSSFPGPAGEQVFFVVTATTLFFEIAGPPLRKIALQRAGELQAGSE